MSRNRKWLAATAAVVMVAAFAAPVFHKAIQAALARAASVRVALQAAPGDPAEPIEARGSQPKRPPVSLTIAGEISGLAPGAAPESILVRVGNRSFAGQIQGGGYVATVDALDPAEMVDVEVLSQRVRYRSVVGSFGKLIAHTGGDRRVDAVELPTLRVSPWSSALAFLVRTALKGRDAVSDQEFERATRAVSGADLFTANNLLAGVASGAAALPGGYTDGQQFLQDENAYRNWIGSVSWPADPELAFAQADYAPLRDLSELPSQMLLMAPVQLDNVPVFSSAPQLLLANTDGSYSLHDGQAEPGRPNYDAQLDASGEVVLLPKSPRVIDRYEGIGRTRMTLARIVLRRMFDGDRHDLWVTREEWTRSFPDDPSREPQAYHPVSLWSVADLHAIARANTWIAAPSRRALPWVCAIPVNIPTHHELLGECGFVQHRFDPGGSGVTEDHGNKVGANMQPQPAGAGSDFGWIVERTQLLVQTPQVSLRYWSIDGEDYADTVIYLATGTSSGVLGQTVVGVSGSLAVDSVPYTAAQAQGTWTLGTAFAQAAAYPNLHYTLEIQRNADGSGEYRDDSVESGAYTILMRWQVASERLYETQTRARFPSGGTRFVSDCASAFADGAQACAPTRIRYFRPLKRVGDRLYGIEELHTQFELKPPGYTGNYEVYVNVRPTFQQCLGGSCLASPPALRLPANPTAVESAVKIPILAVVRPGKTRTAMPIYAFQCSACGHSFDRLQKLSDADPSVCPSCGAEAVSRQLTAPQFRLAGGGWYETDFKKDGDKKRNLADAAGSSGSDKPKPAESKTETKAEPAKSEPKPAAKPAASSD
ncbi:zinc ribbon domain-containing protein [Lysobacter sp. Root983]|uniref:FmdB family zinc ribbon protein n=1 Tax=Lysobacter sp. Root983 TaxID=1736613 RepID=UPI000ACBB27F